MNRSTGYKIKPEHILAGLVILGCMTLMALGKDDVVKSVFIVIVAYYFPKGKKTVK